LRCSLCFEPLQEEYSLWGQLPCHEQCLAARVAADRGDCVGCNLPLQDGWLTVGGTGPLSGNWHEACFRCDLCKTPVDSDYVAVEDPGATARPCHAACFNARLLREAGPCFVCGEPFSVAEVQEPRAMVNVGGLRLHARCLRCPVCERKLKSAQLDPFWLSLCCAGHSSDGTPTCSCCLRLSHRAAPHTRVNEISHLCWECAPSAVGNQVQAQALFDEVGAYFRSVKAWGERTPLPRLQLVDQVEMHKLRSRGISVHMTSIILGLCVSSHIRQEIVRRDGDEERYGLRRVGSRVQYIALQKDLGLLQAGGTLAHELGHAHFATAGYPDLPRKLEEGLCEVWSVMWLEHMLGKDMAGRSVSVGALLAAQTLNSVDPIYGDGAREAMAAVRQHGWPAVLEYVKGRARLPPMPGTELAAEV